MPGASGVWVGTDWHRLRDQTTPPASHGPALLSEATRGPAKAPHARDSSELRGGPPGPLRVSVDSLSRAAGRGGGDARNAFSYIRLNESANLEAHPRNRQTPSPEEQRVPWGAGGQAEGGGDGGFGHKRGTVPPRRALPGGERGERCSERPPHTKERQLTGVTGRAPGTQRGAQPPPPPGGGSSVGARSLAPKPPEETRRVGRGPFLQSPLSQRVTRQPPSLSRPLARESDSWATSTSPQQGPEGAPRCGRQRGGNAPRDSASPPGKWGCSWSVCRRHPDPHGPAAPGREGALGAG